MERPSVAGLRPWGIVGAAIAGLMLAIAGAGIALFVENERVKNVTERALRSDIEIEDEGDDLRVAVLDMRHHHRNLVFGGPTAENLANYEQAYRDLLEEIDELERVEITDPGVPQPAEIRELAQRYYADFRPAVVLYDSDPSAFQLASSEGLLRIDEMDDAADEIDDLGERLAEASLTRIDEAATTERFFLVGLVGGVALVGVVLAIVAGRVLTRLHASYAREQAAVQELERILRTKTDFIGDASHELRTPLTVIQGNAEIGLGTTEAPVQREVLAEILAEANRMSKLVDDLLFLARSDAGLPPLEKELVPARWLMARLSKPAEVLARQRSAALTVEASGDGYLEVDPRRVEQAVLILVDNAAKHAPPETRVALTARVDGDDLAIEVADAGPGIPPEELPLVFDRFYQVGNRRARKKGGSGLGLSIAKTIVEAHGGSIGLESRLNEGTRTTIRLPLCAAAEATNGQERRAAQA
jgi:two-component system, OmpR family, sensor histidine kinase VicK